jgi:hypothetical protein
MGASGTTTINFGAAPGTFEASVAVTGQGSILAGSLVEAWIMPTATADHSADEHLIDPPRIIAGTVSAGVGFTVYGYARETGASPVNADGRQGFKSQDQQPRLYGLYTISWVWN